MELLTLQRHGVSRHFGDVLGQVDVGRAGLVLLGVFESQPHDLAHRIGADDLLRALGDRLEHCGQVEVLMAGQLHPVGAHLACDGHQRRTVQIGIGHAGDEVCGTGAKGGQADACAAGQAAVDICHKGCALLMADRNEADAAVPDGEHQVQRLFAGDAEHDIHALGFQAVYEDLCGGF